jgi:hypothetical protein
MDTTVKYKVFRVMKNSGRRITIAKNLTREEAKRLVNSFPDKNNSMVCMNPQ